MKTNTLIPLSLSRLTLESLQEMLDEAIGIYTHLGDSVDNDKGGVEYYGIADSFRKDKETIERVLIQDDLKRGYKHG